MIPTEALSITLDTAHMNLNDLELLQGEEFTVKGFKSFMDRHSNWTAEQVGLLEVNELESVFKQFLEKLKENAVPKANGNGSSNGRRARKTRRRPHGPTVSPTPKDLESNRTP